MKEEWQPTRDRVSTGTSGTGRGTCTRPTAASCPVRNGGDRREPGRPRACPPRRAVPMRRKRVTRSARIGRMLVLLAASLVVILCLIGASLLISRIFFVDQEPIAPSGDDIPDQAGETGSPIATPGTHPFADGPSGKVTFPFAADSLVVGKNSINSVRAVVVNVSDGEVVASRLSDEKMYPASLTKIMTLIVAVENLPERVSLSYKVTVSREVYDAMYLAGSSGMGLETGEQLTVESLLYLTILRSDGIAASELARYIAGDEASFVRLMNRKVTEMGLENTHFSNPTGLQDEANYSTCRDMAAILSYAMRMSLCRHVLTAASYDALCTETIGKNAGHSFTYYVTNHFLTTLLTEKYPGNKPASLTITAGKTGYAGNNSGYCLASYAVGADGKAYICVTSQATGAEGYLSCIRDHVRLYDLCTEGT